MISHTTAQFRELYWVLPNEVRNHARKGYARFKQNPSHPGLVFKQVHPSKPIYSARVSRNYRVLGIREDNTLIWFWIGTHAEYDKIISQL